MEVVECRAEALCGARRQETGRSAAGAESRPTGAQLTLSSREGSAREDVQVAVEKGGVLRAADLAKVGILSYDPGYTNTACCTSSITYIDGDRGILRYRGYDISEVAAQTSFLDVAWLLFHGELPSAEQHGELWNATVQECAEVSALRQVKDVVSALGPSAHPMGALASAVAAWGTTRPQHNPALVGSALYEDANFRASMLARAVGGFVSLAAMIFCETHGVEQVESRRRPTLPPSHRSVAGLFLHSVGMQKVPLSVVRALDVLLVLHADHELNCSTATMRQLASSGVDLYSALSGAVCALYGPLHGGATEAVLKMLAKIGDASNIPEFVSRVKRREAKMMGFGHRVYKNYDPRAKLIRGIAHQVLRDLRVDNPLLEVASALEKVALGDEFFAERKLYPNVDFYSGIIYSAIGFKPEFFPVLFALGRVSGWMAHWNEFLQDSARERKIARPRQLYTGPQLRPLLAPKL